MSKKLPPPPSDSPRWKRIAWARKRKFRYASEMAAALRMKPGTYRAYERDESGDSKTSTPDNETIERMAEILDVDWVWLLRGHGTFDGHLVRRVVRLLEPLSQDQQEGVLETLEGLVRVARSSIGT